MGLFDKFRKKKEEEVPKKNKLDINPEEYDINEIEMSFSPSYTSLNYTSPNYTSKRVTEAEKTLKEAESKLKKQQIELEKTERENERLVNDVESRLDALDDLPGARRARNVVAEEVSKIKYESKEQSFDEKYKLIQALETYTRMNLRPGENNDLKPNVYDFYQTLPEISKSKVFLPYYLEKKELNIATAADLNKLKEITNIVGEDIAKGYIEGLGVLDALGLTDVLDESNFSASYAKYSPVGRDYVKEVSNLLKEKIEKETKKPMTR